LVELKQPKLAVVELMSNKKNNLLFSDGVKPWFGSYFIYFFETKIFLQKTLLASIPQIYINKTAASAESIQQQQNYKFPGFSLSLMHKFTIVMHKLLLYPKLWLFLASCIGEGWSRGWQPERSKDH
jgi:hypothetical protein